MSLSCGIVGLPNVGKSSLFNIMTNSTCAANNFPFCTIDPNEGLSIVNCERLYEISKYTKAKNIIPSTLKLVDIAGLIKGASTGEGLGNKFLSHIREVDGIIHVVRCFNNTKITHVSGDIDPLRDIDVINVELMLADIESLEKARSRFKKNNISDSDRYKLDWINRMLEHISKGLPARQFNSQEYELVFLKNYPLLTSKPLLYLINVNIDEYDSDNYIKLKNKLESLNEIYIPISISWETELASFSQDEINELYPDGIYQKSRMAELLKECLKLLKLETFFTAGDKEVRAWIYKKGSRAPEAAGIIHSDFERGFIRAEVIHYDDFINFKGEKGARLAGKATIEGKEYIVQDGDIMHFRFNV